MSAPHESANGGPTIGFDLVDDTTRLLSVRRRYAALAQALAANPDLAVARSHVAGYLAELDGVIRARATASRPWPGAGEAGR